MERSEYRLACAWLNFCPVRAIYNARSTSQTYTRKCDPLFVTSGKPHSSLIV
jgi:hypothetical protein